MADAVTTNTKTSRESVTAESGGNGKLFNRENFLEQLGVLNIVLNHITQGIVVVGPDYSVLAFNRSYVEMFQLTPGTVAVGVDFRDILRTWAAETGQDQQMLDRAIHELDEPSPFEFEFPQLIHGVPRWCLLTHNPLPGKGFVRTFTDITRRKELENEQLKMEKLESLGILAGGIAHDFNNIITAIMGNISFAQLFLDVDHKSYKPLVKAEKASIRATELAQQLLTFASGGEPVKKVVSLRHLVNESVSLVLHGSNVRGCVDIPDTIHAVEVDEGQLHQVINNIIINAAQAMPGGGSLAITAQNETLGENNPLSLPPGTYIRMTFTDQGCGIPDADLKRIFDPYFTTKVAGKGLGLASAHSIINRHGGHIGASSVPGKGTTFTIHLPSIGETYSTYQTDTCAQTISDHSGGSILVMDDEAMILDMTAEMLEYLGYRVITCENGEEAIERYRSGMEAGTPFSAVIMDLTIPGAMGGKEAAAQILAIDPQARLIVSSGYSNDPIMSDFETYGFKIAIAKPYTITKLAQLLGAVLMER